jgi:hypothetical protein
LSDPQAVPEPASLALFAAGAILLQLVRADVKYGARGNPRRSAR